MIEEAVKKAVLKGNAVGSHAYAAAKAEHDAAYANIRGPLLLMAALSLCLSCSAILFVWYRYSGTTGAGYNSGTYNFTAEDEFEDREMRNQRGVQQKLPPVGRSRRGDAPGE